MSRPDSMTGCESDEIGQKMCLGDAVGTSDLQMLDAPFFQNRMPLLVLACVCISTIVIAFPMAYILGWL